MLRPIIPRLLPLLAAALALLVPAGTAHAKKFSFGTQDYLVPLQDIELKGRQGEALALGHKYSHHAFILPYAMSDEGYVLIVKGKSSYYRLDEKLINELQAKGALPSPLPPYELAAMEYVLGHLLWIVIGVIGAMIGWGAYRKRRETQALALVASGDTSLGQGNHDAAIADYSKAIKLAPRNVEAFHHRAIAYEARKDIDQAIADHTTVIRLAPKSADAFLMRAGANQQKGDHDRAIVDFGSVLRLQPDHVLGLVGRSISYRHKQAWREALADCNRVIELAPEAPAAWINRAETYEAQGAAELAAADRASAAALVQRTAGEQQA